MTRGLKIASALVLAPIAMGPGANRVMESRFQQPRAAVNIVGSWRLVSIATVRPNGEEVTDWMGPKPSGLLSYQSDGYMSVHIVHDPPARWSYSSPEQASVDERAAAFDRYYAYFGRYEVDATRGIVKHFVQGSLQPNEVGLTYQRRFTLDGDRLSLTATPFTFKGEQRFNKLVWQRVK